MVIFFTRLIHHVSDRLHLALPPLQRRPPHPMGLNLGTYNIWYDCGFGIPQAICSIEQGNYYLMLLTETNILDAVYFHNRLSCYNVFSKATVTTDWWTQGRAQGRGWNNISEESVKVDFRVNALAWDELDELRTRFQRPMNANNWGIPATIKPRSPSRIGGGAEPLPGQGHCCTRGA